MHWFHGNFSKTAVLCKIQEQFDNFFRNMDGYFAENEEKSEVEESSGLTSDIPDDESIGIELENSGLPPEDNANETLIVFDQALQSKFGFLSGKFGTFLI